MLFFLASNSQFFVVSYVLLVILSNLFYRHYRIGASLLTEPSKAPAVSLHFPDASVFFHLNSLLIPQVDDENRVFSAQVLNVDLFHVSMKGNEPVSFHYLQNQIRSHSSTLKRLQTSHGPVWWAPVSSFKREAD